MKSCLKVKHIAWKKRCERNFTYSLNVVLIRGTLKVANCRFTACSSSSRGCFFISFLFSINWSKACTPFSTCKHTWHCQCTNTHMAMALWVHIQSQQTTPPPPTKKVSILFSVLPMLLLLVLLSTTSYLQLSLSLILPPNSSWLEQPAHRCSKQSWNLLNTGTKQLKLSASGNS